MGDGEGGQGISVGWLIAKRKLSRQPVVLTRIIVIKYQISRIDVFWTKLSGSTWGQQLVEVYSNTVYSIHTAPIAFYTYDFLSVFL